MVNIKITKGLDIPIKGKPKGGINPFVPGGEVSILTAPRQISLNLSPFEDTRFKLLCKVNDIVKIGQPIAEDKSHPGRMFVAPAGGMISDIRRGEKRRLLDIVIDVGHPEEIVQHPVLDPSTASREQIIEHLKVGGAFSHIRSRPFNILADPEKKPRSVFVKALESAPFMPPAEIQVLGHEKEFQTGLDALSKLTDGSVHLVFYKNTASLAFLQAKNVEKHTAEGPHPIANPSVHIERIDPIRSSSDIVWTLNAHDVILIGHLLLNGRYFIDRVISIAGPGVLDDRVGFFRSREGFPIAPLIAGRVKKELLRFISGDVLTGTQVDASDFLGFFDYAFSVVPENTHREFLHFFRPGSGKYTFSHAYVSGHFDNSKREYDFTTSLHGEHRPFIDSSLYDKVMPLKVPTMLLVKAVMAEDFDLAETLGLLEVDSEDFSLPTFVDPSKMEMIEIMKRGLAQYAKQVLH